MTLKWIPDRLKIGTWTRVANLPYHLKKKFVPILRTDLFAFINMRISHIRLGLTCFGLLLASCRQNNPHDEVTQPKPVTISWTNMLNQYRGTILTGSWEQAENLWAKLNVIKPSNREDLGQWIQFQVEILETTTNDPLKDQLRMGAIQQMYFNPDISRAYLPWLEKGLDTGLFIDPEVQKKADELAHEMQVNVMTNKP